MKYECFKWYPVTDDAYWSNEPNIQTVVKSPYDENLLVQNDCPYGWGTMTKTEGFYFMNIDKTITNG